jgi:hypothetical protein
MAVTASSENCHRLARRIFFTTCSVGFFTNLERPDRARSSRAVVQVNGWWHRRQSIDVVIRYGSSFGYGSPPISARCIVPAARVLALSAEAYPVVPGFPQLAFEERRTRSGAGAGVLREA